MRITILIVVSALACVMANPRAGAQTSTATPPAHPVLLIQSTPGGTQVYVDDELLGTTSPEGRLKISTLKPGKHTLRLSLGGNSYGEGHLTLVAGKTLTKTVTLTERNVAANPTPATTPPQAGEVSPVSDILTWIGSHFEATTYYLTATDGTSGTTASFSMAFQGCQATIVRTEYNSARRSTWTIGPFDLSNLRPDKVTITTGKATTAADSVSFFYLGIYAASSTISLQSTTELAAWPAASMPARTVTDPIQSVGVFNIQFATYDLANRQAKAWHDAIIACGGKPISDKLY